MTSAYNSSTVVGWGASLEASQEVARYLCWIPEVSPHNEVFSRVRDEALLRLKPRRGRQLMRLNITKIGSSIKERSWLGDRRQWGVNEQPSGCYSRTNQIRRGSERRMESEKSVTERSRCRNVFQYVLWWSKSTMNHGLVRTTSRRCGRSSSTEWARIQACSEWRGSRQENRDACG